MTNVGLFRDVFMIFCFCATQDKEGSIAAKETFRWKKMIDQRGVFLAGTHSLPQKKTPIHAISLTTYLLSLQDAYVALLITALERRFTYRYSRMRSQLNLPVPTYRDTWHGYREGWSINSWCQCRDHTHRLISNAHRYSRRTARCRDLYATARWCVMQVQ